MNGITTRLLTTVDEYRDAVAIQKAVWGFDDVELLPVRLFVVASKIGGQSFGAFDGGKMVGFTIAIPGLKHRGGAAERGYLHSHMLGVLPEYRNRGIGRLLKLAQREKAIAEGVDLMEWTFDPLELKNAYLNIEKLGVVVRRYVLNQYGTTTSHLHGLLPTDRCIAEWWLRSERVEAAVSGRERGAVAIAGRIEVPVEVETLRREDPRCAREIQARVSDSFMTAFARGLVVVGFERGSEACAYLLADGPLEP